MSDLVDTPMVGRAVSHAGELGGDAIREYWHRVEKTLKAVFRKDEQAARDLVDGLRERLRRASCDQDLAIYHDEPLHVAADLAGVGDRVRTAEEMDRYLDLVVGAGDRPDSRTFWPQPVAGPASAGS